MARSWILACLLVSARGPAAAVVLGGGLTDTDCTVAFDGVDATAGASGVVCTDGDPGCDRDGAADGSCRFTVRLCTRVVAAGCTPRDVSSLTVAGLPLEAPAVASGIPTCAAASVVTVPAGAALGATTIARAGDAPKDVDYLSLCCDGAPAALDAAHCALAVDPAIAGCRAAVPPGIALRFARARRLAERAAAEPAHAGALARKAARVLGRLVTRARRLAERDDCGFTLGLIANHARDSVRAGAGEP